MRTITELEEILEKSENSDRIEPLLTLSFMLHMSDLPRMRQLTEEALVLARQIGDKLEESRGYNNLSVYWGVRGEYAKSLENAFKSLEILLEMDEKEPLAGRYNNISLIYKLMGDKLNSKKYCTIALEVAKEFASVLDQASALNNMATIYESDGDYLTALNYYHKTAKLFESLEGRSHLAVVQVNIIRLYIKTSQLSKAQNYLEEVETIVKEDDSNYLNITILLVKGELASAKGDYEESLKFLTEGLRIASESEEPTLLKEFFQALVGLSEQFNHYQEALQYYRELVSLKDKLQNEETTRHMNQLRAEFDFKEKEREAEIYRLRNVELQTAKEQAEAANIAKGSFLAVMSHEIRTPISVLQGMLELTMETDLSEKQSTYLSKASLASKSLLGVIDDILDFSKISADKIEYETIVFDIIEVLEDTVSIFRENVINQGLYFNIEFDKHLPSCLVGDPFRLGQILRNLIANAVKFTSTGGITVSAAIQSAHDSIVTIEFCIKDTGIGIKAEKVEELFEPFNQAESSFKRRFGGTGLGLAICNRLAEGMQGKMWVESAPGKGSNFFFSLPFKTTPHKEPVDTEEVDFSPELEITGKKILLVDDVDTIREITGLFLTSVNIDYEEAINGIVAVEKVINQEFDLILMDVQMAELDGLTATKQIRASGNNTIIIAMTAHAMNDQIELCKEAGMNDVLTKPFSRSELISMLRKWL